ncbi:MAG: hypothetical protein AAFU54_04435 [Chloroflexota bacterium]
MEDKRQGSEQLPEKSKVVSLEAERPPHLKSYSQEVSCSPVEIAAYLDVLSDIVRQVASQEESQ